jgi:hypothetical protein
VGQAEESLDSSHAWVKLQGSYEQIGCHGPYYSTIMSQTRERPLNPLEGAAAGLMESNRNYAEPSVVQDVGIGRED